MNLRYPRWLAVCVAVLFPLIASSAMLLPTQARPQRVFALANVARTRPAMLPRTLVASQASTLATSFPATMSENFEGAWPSAGWALQDYGTSGGEYLFGKRDCNPQSGRFAAWGGGGGADGAKLACDAKYANNVYTLATYGPFDLTNAASSIVSFAFTGASEAGYDTLYVAASIDDYYYCGSSYSGDYAAGYVQGTLDLSDLNCPGQPTTMLGQTNVTIAFFFISDTSVNDIGFNIDNIRLESVQNTPTATHTRTSTPTSAPTDTPTNTPTNTPVGPTDTPTNTPVGPTDTPTNTPTNTPTDTPTNTPTNTPTTTPTDVPAAPALNLTVGGIDTSQAVQTTNNSVPLVAGRPAIVRVSVNVQNSAEPVLGVTGRLHGARNGSELPNSPLTPFNNGGSIVAQLAQNRESFASTLNFQIPADWTAGGQLVLWAEVNPNHTIGEGDYNDNRSPDLTLRFVSVPTLQVMLIPIAYQPNGVGPIMRPDLTQNNQGLTNLQNLFPIADVQTTLHNEYLFTGVLSGNGWSRLLNELTAVRNRELGGAASTSKVVYYGVVPQAAVAGLASFTAGIGWVGGNILTSVGLEQSVGVAAHEIGHNLGLNHAPCGVAGDPDYPFADARIGDVGFDAYTRQFHPSTDKDFMSYCQPIWVSAYHYNKMLQVLAPGAAAQSATTALSDGMLISGNVYSDTLTSQLNASVPLSSTTTLPAGGDGEYRIELRNASGAMEYSRAFTPPTIDSHTEAPDYGFSFVVPLVNNLARIQLWKGNILLSEQRASNIQPDLRASFRDSANTLTVNWQASSADGAPVTVALRYSSDNGLSWRVLALQQTGTSYTIDKRNLPGGTGGRLEVIAENTTRTRTVSLNVGAIGNKLPVLSIAGGSNIQQYRGQALLLQAVALDLEDGYLQGNSLVWTDENGQVLGMGETLSLPAGLPLGKHTITLTATDSDAGVTRDTVTVSVIQPPPVSLQKFFSIFLPLARGR